MNGEDFVQPSPLRDVSSTSTVNTGAYVHDIKTEIIRECDKWWIDRVGEDIIEVFLNVPMNDANKETLLKTWQRLKKEAEDKWNF